MSQHINQMAVDIRRVHAARKGVDKIRTYSIGLPIRYIRVLGIESGDFMEISIEDDKIILKPLEGKVSYNESHGKMVRIQGACG
jgi:bifunctional DNA-binding transcriptional regulator/antitoxin component of YhaV-PrlF toxin-antitoxin module